MTADRDAGTLLRQLDNTGLFATDGDTARVVFNAAASLGFNAYRVDLSLVTNSRKLFDILGRSLHFPDWFGSNWDALADCLADMSWNEADGYVLILQRLHALQQSEPQTIVSLFDLLRDTATGWRAQGVPFWALVDEPVGALPLFQVES